MQLVVLMCLMQLQTVKKILLIDRLMESIDSVDEISTRDLAIAIKAENKDNRYEFYKDVKVNESLSV